MAEPTHDTGTTHIADALDQLMPWLGNRSVPGTPEEQASWLAWLTEQGPSAYDDGPGYGSRPFSGTGGYWDKPQPVTPPDLLPPPVPRSGTFFPQPTPPLPPIQEIPIPAQPPVLPPPQYIPPDEGKAGGMYPLAPPWQPDGTWIDPGSGQPMPTQPPPVRPPQPIVPDLYSNDHFVGKAGRMADVTDEFGNPVGAYPAYAKYPTFAPWKPADRYRGDVDIIGKRPPQAREAANDTGFNPPILPPEPAPAPPMLNLLGFTGQPGHNADVTDEFGNPISGRVPWRDTLIRRLEPISSRRLSPAPSSYSGVPISAPSYAQDTDTIQVARAIQTLAAKQPGRNVMA